MKYAIAFVSALLGAFMLSATPLHAQEYNKTKVIESFDEASLKAVLNELGATMNRRDDGAYDIVFSSGLKATAKLTACTEGRCLGTEVTANFGASSKRTPATTSEFVDEYNRKHRTIKIYKRPEGKSAAQLYIIADEGITMGNYRRQLSLFSFMLGKYRDALFMRE